MQAVMKNDEAEKMRNASIVDLTNKQDHEEQTSFSQEAAASLLKLEYVEEGKRLRSQSKLSCSGL